MTSLFGSTYLCEQVFSRMNHVKSPVRSLLSDSHMENSLRIATSSILPNIANLLEKNSAKLHIEMSKCSKSFVDFTVGMFIVLIIVKEDNTNF